MLRLLNKIKDPVSCLTHFAGFIGGIVALILLLKSAGGIAEISAFAVFGSTLILMYLASTVYHLFELDEKGTRLLRKFDHIMIYLFIAGTFTPFAVLVMDGWVKWAVLISIWVLAVLGVMFKLFWLDAPRWVSTAFYLGMGWMGLIVLPYIFTLLPAPAAFWMIMGGLAYTFGAVIYGLKKPDPFPEWFGFHEIWHLWVLAGSFCHFWAIYRYLPSF